MFSTWKSVTLGVYTTPDEYLSALRSQGIVIESPSLEEMLRSAEFEIAPKGTVANLTVVDPNLLRNNVFGVRWDRFNYADFHACGLSSGLRLCTIETAVALAFSFEPHGLNSHLGCGHWAHIAMKGIPVAFGKISAHISLTLSTSGGQVRIAEDRLDARRFCHRTTPMIFQIP